MLTLLTSVFALLGYLWIFWGAYVLVMGIYRAYLSNRLTKLTLALSLPFVIGGIALDILANIFIATVLFLELPQEWLVTSRLIRLQAEPAGTWRKKYADWICSNLLDVFDPYGIHCRPENK
jgi:hypothetical protein